MALNSALSENRKKIEWIVLERASPASAALVIGGGGFIGSALRKKLTAAYAEVTVLCRSKPIEPMALNEKWATGDMADARLLSSLLSEGQDVYHLVSNSIPANGNWDVTNDIHQSVLPTLELLKLCITHKIRRVIFVSSGGTVYGLGAPVPTPEDAGTAPITSYGTTKLIIENYLRIFKYHHGLDYRIARVANPYGPGQFPMRQQGVIANLMHQALQGLPFQIWGDGSVARDFIHVDDVASALIELASHTGESAVFNVGSGHARTIISIAKDIANTIGAPDHPTLFHPARSFDVPVSYLDITRLTSETHWAPRQSWTEGLQQTFDWIKAQRF